MIPQLFIALEPLLAQRDNWTRLGDRFTGHHLRVQPEDVIGGILLIAAGGLLFFGLAYARKVGERMSRPQEPRDVFQKLKDAHRLSRSECRLISDIAEREGLGSPAEVFVRPELFADEATRAQRSLKALGQRLFSTPE